MMNNPYKPYPGSLYGVSLKEYIENTTILTKPEEVKQFIQYFIWKLAFKKKFVSEQVSHLLNYLLTNEKSHQKVHIVSLTSWRNGVIQIYPNKVIMNQSGRNMNEAIENYLDNYEIVFLYLNEQIHNPFQNPSVAISQESENLKYYYTLQNSWKNDYQTFKKATIDRKLDEYNQLIEQYKFTGEDHYFNHAKAKITEMKKLVKEVHG